MDKSQVVSLVRRYVSEVTKELQPERIVLFGSYVAGNAREESDIDIAVIYNSFSGDFLGTSSRLWSLGRSISPYIEPILLDRANDKSGFVGEVLKTGETMYQRPESELQIVVEK
jgi:predicted nucleotidyltransferase